MRPAFAARLITRLLSILLPVFAVLNFRSMLYPSVIKPVKRFWSFYCRQLDRRPLVSRCLTGVVGALAGDFVAQSAERAAVRSGVLHHTSAGSIHDLSPIVPDYDVWRTVRLAVWGLFVGTPLSYYWLQLLDTKVMPHKPRSPQAVFLKTLIDQAVMAPIGTAIFFFGMNTLEGHPGEFVHAMQTKFLPTMTANYMLWPLAHIINFAFVPASQRILYANVVGVLWTAVLSHLALSGHHWSSSGEGPSMTALPGTAEKLKLS